MGLSSADLAAIRAAERALQEAVEAPEPTAWVDCYTEDAVFLAPGRPVIEGREALLAHARQMSRMSSLRIDPKSTDGDGDVAAVVAFASWVTGPRGSDAPTTRVRSLMVWRREADGHWRVCREMLNLGAGGA